MRIISYLAAKVGDLTKQFSNFPDSYIKRSFEQVYWKTPKGPQYMRKEISRRKYRFTSNSPWTSQFRQQNAPGTKRKKVFIEPIGEWSFFKGDRVEVMIGKDRGKQGIVNQVVQERNWVYVEGLNTHLRKVGEDKNFPGVYVQSEAPLLVTDQVKLVDPETLKPTEVEWRFTEDGNKVRVSTVTSRIIPVPAQSFETKDYKTRSTYKENETKDTVADVIQEITFEPKLRTFEMDIMEEMGIKEDRIPKRTFWY